MAPTMNRQLTRHRAEQAERMHATGASWQEIADALGFKTRQGAIMAVQRLRNTTPPETVEQARAKHDSTLRMIQQRMFAGFLRADQARDDETAIKYAKEIRGIVGERAKLHGSYAPQRTEVDVTVTETPAALLAQTRQRLMAAIDAEVIETKELEA
jgi:AraC-like DNA-binding protein